MIKKSWERQEMESLKKLKKEVRKKRISSNKSPFASSYKTSLKTSQKGKIDPDLLTQAFNYGKSQKMISDLSSGPRSKAEPNSGKLSFSMKKNVKKKKSRKRSTSSSMKMKRDMQIAAYDPSGRNPAESKLDVDEMVRNFTEGVNLKQLRKELDRSKNSLKQSDTFIRAAAQQWFN